MQTIYLTQQSKQKYDQMLYRELLTHTKQRSLSAAVPSPGVTALNPSTVFSKLQAPSRATQSAQRPLYAWHPCTAALNIRTFPAPGTASHPADQRPCVVGCLEFSVPFQHKYGYIRDDSMRGSVRPRTELAIVRHRTGILGVASTRSHDDSTPRRQFAPQSDK